MNNFTKNESKKSTSSQSIYKQAFLKFCLVGPAIPVVLVSAIGIPSLIITIALDLNNNVSDIYSAFTFSAISLLFSYPVGIIPAAISAAAYAFFISHYTSSIESFPYKPVIAHLMIGAGIGLILGFAIDLILQFELGILFTSCCSVSSALSAVLTSRALAQAPTYDWG